MPHLASQTASILLYGRDARLVETRSWVLEKEGFSVFSAFSLTDLQKTAAEQQVDLFLLCDSLDIELRSSALSLIHSNWPDAKRLVLAPASLPAGTELTEKVFPAMEGPGKLVEAIRTLIVNGSASVC